MEMVSNSLQQRLYELVSLDVAKNNGGQPNEKVLYHGTSGDAVNGLPESGFDSTRWDPDGAFGKGAYFAITPAKSHDYTVKVGDCTIFLCKVALGRVEPALQRDAKMFTSPGYHSRHYDPTNRANQITFNNHEHIVYRMNQALPWIRITYHV